MKVVFLCAGYESLGLEYLSAVLKKAGHETSLIFDPVLFNSFIWRNQTLDKVCTFKNIVINRVLELQPDLIAFSAVTDTYGWAIDMARALKKIIKVPVVFGGMHATLVPEVVLKESSVDYVCVGEGEEAFLELVKVLEQQKDASGIQNIWSKKGAEPVKNSLRQLITDLDSLPFPDKELFYREYSGFKHIYAIMTSRGCVFKCTFCYHSYVKDLFKDKGVYLRRRSVDNVITELKEAKERYRIKKVCFFDDLFSYDKEWLKNFSCQYREEISLPFVCAVHPGQVDEEVVLLLEDAGCAVVGLGLQTISSKIREEIFNRKESNQAIEKAISLFRKSKILTSVDILLGAPDQDKQEFLKLAEFLNRHKPDMILPIWLKYYPRLKIVEIAEKKGILDASEIKNIEEKGGTAFFKGTSFDPRLARLSSFIMLSPLIPGKLHRLIIKREWYNSLFALSGFIYLRLALVLITFYKRIFKAKRKYIFSLKDHIKYLCYFFLKKIFN